MNSWSAALALLPVLMAHPASAETFETETGPVEATVLVDGLDHPWGLDFLPGGEVLVTERSGQLRIFGRNGLSEPLDGVPDVAASGQGGLLDIAIAPDFATSNTIFMTFSEPGSGGAGTAVARATLVRDGETARLEGTETIFSMNKKSNRGQHFGSRIVFLPDGTLTFGIGDRGDGPRAQDMKDHAGAILRINQDGSVPADNPWASSPDHAPELWSKGHRNPQGMAYDPVAGTLLTVEHGAKGGDEVNRPEAGKNYGWPVITYGVNYNGRKIGEGTEAPGMEQPLYYWDPSIAPSGLAVYDGDMFPEWRGDLLAGSLKFSLVSRLERDENGKIIGEERMFDRAFGRIRDVNVAPDGSVWLLTDESNGAIIRLARGD